jgi:hypothetical protein
MEFFLFLFFSSVYIADIFVHRWVAENKGFNNRGLLKLGWIDASGNRRTPRTTESKLRSLEELYADRKSLLSAMKNADKFISLVFGSDDENWVARCSSIVRDRR